MKIKFFLFASSLLSIFIWQSCSNDFELNSPWQDVPVIYGIIDITEDNHYIRVQKAFLDPETSALEIAQISDSIYYDNISVSIKVNNDQILNLTRVNAADEGLIKEEGTFATAPHILYKIAQNQANLKAGDKVELIVNRGDDLPAVTAQTTIVGDVQVTEPRKKASGEKLDLNFMNNVPTSILWKASDFAEVYDLKLLFTYEEYFFSTPDDRQTYTIEFPIDKKIENNKEPVSIGPRGSEGVFGSSFFSFIQTNIPIKPDFQRRFKHIDIVITGGSAEIQEAFEILDANTGITSAQEIPVYTNISEGRGFFASRYTTIDMRGLTAQTRDSLANGYRTRDLNFLQ